MKLFIFRGVAEESYDTHHDSVEVGQWVFGYKTSENTIGVTLQEESGGIGPGLINADIIVYKQTLGVFIGQFDKNKKPIFTGDKVIHDDCGEGYVEFNPQLAAFVGPNGCSLYGNDCEIVGSKAEEDGLLVEI